MRHDFKLTLDFLNMLPSSEATGHQGHKLDFDAITRVANSTLIALVGN